VMGVVFALGGVSAFAGAALTTRAIARLGEGKVLAGGYLIGSLSSLLVPLAGGPAWLALGMFAAAQLVGDGAMIAHEITRTSAIQRLTPDRVLGRVLAFYRLVSQSSFLLGTGLAVIAADALGVRGALLAAATLGVLAVSWLVVWRDEPSPAVLPELPLPDL
jgi:MFS family permease